MDLFADWIATKHGMTDTLRMMISSGDITLAQTRSEIRAIVRTLIKAGADSGEVRDDVDAEDVVASLAGILAVVGAPAQRDQAGRLFDLLMADLRTVSEKEQVHGCRPDSRPQFGVASPMGSHDGAPKGGFVIDGTSERDRHSVGPPDKAD